MSLFIILIGGFLSIITTAILAYISIATMIGPWIAPTIVLITTFFTKFRPNKNSLIKNFQDISLIQSIAAGGGVIATGIGFALPILYFLDRKTFEAWLTSPLHFCSLITNACLSAGCLGIMLGRMFAPKMIFNKNLPFPVSQLTYKTITAQSQTSQSKSFFKGVISTITISFFKDGVFYFHGFLPKKISLLQSVFGKELTISIWPTLWAIGYTTGPRIAIPLLIGVISKYFVLYPLNYHASFFSFKLFSAFDPLTFATAFCSGLVLSEVLTGLLKNPKSFYRRIRLYFTEIFKSKKIFNYFSKNPIKQKIVLSKCATYSKILSILEPFLAIISFVFLFSYLNLSLLAQLTLFVFTIIATYEISFIGCKIGLVQFGRYSAFVLIPMILLFKLNFIQITAVCVYFNICAAAASDILFDYKTGEFCGIDQEQIHVAQWIGLIIPSLSIGFILYLLFTQLQLGSEHFFAHRGQSKALLIKTLNFNSYVVSSGFFYGLLLKKLKISPTMTFGGIIMPNNITFSLVIGGFLSLITQKKENYLSFCSGVFASESLWIILSLILKLF
jgi:uncharacterized oligopeptide transporter (OPT) family protein